jgi:hypothetical protein
MDAHVKTLRLVTVSLIFLLLFSFTLTDQRRQLQSGLQRIEKRAVAIRLLKANVADVRVTGWGDHRIDPSCGCVPSAYDQTRAYINFRNRGSLYAQGQRYARNIEELPQSIRQTGGGDLYFTTLMQKTQQLDRMEQVVHPNLPECAFPDEVDSNHDRVFFIPVRVVVDPQHHSDLACGTFDLLFTNAATLVMNPALLDGPACLQAASLMVVMPDNMNPYDVEGLSDDILRIGRSVDVIESDPQRVYWEVRSKYERQVVQIPLVAQNLRIDNALLGVYITALALLAWVSFALRQYLSPSTSEAWILKEPLSTLRRTRWIFMLPAAVEIVLFNLFIAGALLTPAALLWSLHQDTALGASQVVRFVMRGTLPVLVVLEASAISSYIRIVWDSCVQRFHS